MNINQDIIRKHLVDALYGNLSHVSFDEVIKGFPPFAINELIKGVPYSAWQLVDHMSIAQEDIIRFIENPDYETPNWPEDYWNDQLANVDDWDRVIASYVEGRKKLKAMIHDPKTDLTAPLPYAADYTLYREIIVLANHQSYHTGQLQILKRAFM